MAYESRIGYPSGQYTYFIIRQRNGNVWYPTITDFEDWGGGAGRTMNDYYTANTDESGSYHQGSLSDAGFDAAAGAYIKQIFLKAGDNPSDNDPLLGILDLFWDGLQEISELEYSIIYGELTKLWTAAKYLLNKAVQTKATGEIIYYDDDEVTPIITHTPTEDLTEVTRTPS